ncbi:uncharacterized protein KGF55_005350 [Candida pseudojiufengensis]|uniref:uncharacterized protein n=1 Tax=Candida pseudojiufengensis TaxID=497109 RepID=UPI002224816B|nr:uncharacterized protein KGF55_005350 [Candida pseudojiufengensis]KAI5959373.1 hypothetical protein KGF55_005350 [Candida pseudojiufengensis]
MEVSYSNSNVSGYSYDLPTLDVKLPLKYQSTSPSTSSSIIINSDPNEYFHQQSSTSGQFLTLNSNPFVSLISSSIFNDLKTILITPIDFKQNSLRVKLQNIKIHLPNPISSINCISIIQKDQNIYINLIDSKYLFITLQLSIETFIEGRNLNLSDFEKWGHISVPYSFEMRSQPYILKSIDDLSLIVSLEDGGLLNFYRHEPLSDIKIRNFNEPVSIFSGFFAGDKRTDLNGISSNSIVDVLKIDQLLITLTVSKELKIWNTETSQFLSKISLFDKKSRDVWLTTIPTKYLKLISLNGEHYITVLITTEGGESKKSRFAFKTFKLDGTTLKEQGQFYIQPELPNTLLSTSDVYFHDSTFQNTIWFIQDYEVEYTEDEKLNYHILWKSNTTSILVSYTINFVNGSILEIQISSPTPQDDKELSAFHESDYYEREIFDSGFFNDLIVTTSISILSQHLKVEIPKIDTNLKTTANNLINSNSETDSKYLWFKLYSLCKEFKKLSNEVLAITIFGKKYITLNSNGFGVFRHSHYFESFVYKNLSSPDGELIKIFDKFSATLSSKSYHKLYNTILSFQKELNSDYVNDLFKTFIDNKLSNEEINLILIDLSKIPNVLEIIQSLVTIGDYQLINELESYHQLGKFFQYSTFITFKNIIQQHTTILLNLIILFLICEVNDEILKLLNNVVNIIQKYDIFRFILNTNFTTDSNNNKIKGLSDINNSLFWSAIVDKNINLKQLINTSQTNDAFDCLYNDILSKDNFIIDSVVQLINQGEGIYLKKYFVDKLSKTNVEELFLIGIISLLNKEPQTFFNIFLDFEKFENINIKLIYDLKKNENLRPLLIILSDYPTKSDYYHELSKILLTQLSNKNSISLNNQLIEISLKFEKLAIENTEDDEKKQEYNLNIFQNSLNISDYELVKESLNNLQNYSHIKNLFKQFITKLIHEHKYKILFPLENSNNKLFLKNFKLIDSILNQIANDSSLNQSLKIYEILFSWRNFGNSASVKEFELGEGDKRGSCEALYQFIWRYKNEFQFKLQFENQFNDQDQSNDKLKLKILELYIIILNVLKTFNNKTDQWILVQKNESREIININNLQTEYFEWLKEID